MAQTHQKPHLKQSQKRRVSNFELNGGLHKQLSSQFKFEKERRISEMMNKPGIHPSPIRDRIASLEANRKNAINIEDPLNK